VLQFSEFRHKMCRGYWYQRRDRYQHNWKGRINQETLFPVEESVIERWTGYWGRNSDDIAVTVRRLYKVKK